MCQRKTPLAFSLYIRNFATFFPRILTRQSAGVFRYSSGFTKMHYDLLQRIEHYYKDRKDKKISCVHKLYSWQVVHGISSCKYIQNP